MKVLVNGLEVEGSVGEMRELLGIGVPASSSVSSGEVKRAQTFPIEQTRDTIIGDEEKLAMLKKLLGMSDTPVESPVATSVKAAPVEQPIVEQSVVLPNGQPMELKGVRLASRAEVRPSDSMGPKGTGSSGKAPMFQGMDPTELIKLANANPGDYPNSERSSRGRR
jgi:hypothetical protein